jgi:hypothetical protein
MIRSHWFHEATNLAKQDKTILVYLAELHAKKPVFRTRTQIGSGFNQVSGSVLFQYHLTQLSL